MNECEKYQEMISAMLDGELDPADSEQLIAHMSSCAGCRELYEMLSAVTGDSVWELPPAPEGLHEHIMHGVKNAAADRWQKTLITRLRPWAMTAACLVLIAGVILGVPRFFRAGNSSAPAAFNTTAVASGNSASAPAPAADCAAPADVPADGAKSEEGYEYNAQYGTSSGAADNGTPVPAERDIAGTVNDGDIPEPLPEPEAAPESPEPPALDVDIDRSVITVESGGKSTTEKLGRDDTLIWLRFIIEDRAGEGIDAAKIEIFRFEGADYEVYFRRDGQKLTGSLSKDMTDSIELTQLGDFAQFEEMAGSSK